MCVEFQVALGNYSPAVTTLNQLRVRNGLSATYPTNPTDAATAYSETWQKEMYRQGDRFTNLVRWGMATQVLGANGYYYNNSLLPIPSDLLNTYPGLQQNPGY